MTPAEAVRLVRLVKACCPAQAIDEFTPDVWAGLLADIRLADAVEAVKALGRAQRYIAPSEIVQAVQRARQARLDRVVLTPPAELADDPAGQRAWLREARRRVADGEPAPEPAGLVERPVRALLAGAFKEIPK